MNHMFIKFHNVDFYYDSISDILFEDITLHITSGWFGVIGPNGAGKTTFLKLATGSLKPCGGYIEIPQRVVYCSQRTDDAPQHFSNFLDSLSKSAHIIKGQLNINADWVRRWHTLSHGERKRAQIGVALWLEPDVLAIDEPTNHLDLQTRKLIMAALRSFPKIGLLVSHDRKLLDSLCQRSIFIEPPHVVNRKGGYTKGKGIAQEEQTSARKQHAIRKQIYKKLRREAGKRRNKSNQADKKRSKKGISKKDHDAKQKIDGARLSGKDGVHGKLLRQLNGRLYRAQQSLQEIKVKKESSLGIWLPGTQSKRDNLLVLSEGALMLGDQKKLYYPTILVKPNDRLGLTGQNGSGKSTLLKKMVSYINLPKEHVTYIPQEIDATQSKEILNQTQTLSNHQKGHMMTIVSRLGSCPKRLLDSTMPSPGETRKLLLALGMTRQPHVIIMDEPTNHMDLPSIECLEQALFDCPCCLILISHDLRFLDKLTQQRWHIKKETERKYSLTILS